jgi:putative ABC transport system substrate-binding protein
LPIECGLIDSYARPGRNCTGIAFSAGFELYAKRLEIIRAIAPSARRLALLFGDTRQLTVSGEPLDAMWSEVAAAAIAQGFEHTIHMVHRIEDIGPALAEAAGARAQAASIAGDWFVGAASQVVDFALRQRWVTTTLHAELFDAGLLLYHGPSQADGIYATGRMQQMVDRILRGANPANIPVEIPSRFEFALNLKTARALGLTLPPSVLLRADRVVE